MFRTIFASLILLLSCTHARAAVVNGSFESGDFTGWTTVTTGSPFVDWSVNGAGAGSGFFAPTSPQAGSFDAWNGFDGSGPMQFQLYQDVSLPLGSTLLGWQDRIQWDFALTSTATQARSYDVEIRDPGTNALLATLYSFSTGTAIQVGDTGWQAHTADVSAFAGSSVRLLFNESSPEAFTGPGQLEVDDVVLQNPSAVVPEPSAWLMATLGAITLVARRRARTEES